MGKSGILSSGGAQPSHCSDYSFIAERRLWVTRTQELWHMGLVAGGRGVFPDQDRTHAACIDRQILNDWTTRKPMIDS